jgi:hypothetical protein
MKLVFLLEETKVFAGLFASLPLDKIALLHFVMTGVSSVK